MDFKAPGADDERISWMLGQTRQAQQTLDSAVAEARGLPDAEPSKAARITRLNALKREVNTAFDDLDRSTLQWATNDIPSLYTEGWMVGATQLGAGMDFSLAHRDALAILSADAYTDVANNLQQVRQGFSDTADLQSLYEGMDPEQILAIQDKSRTAIAQSMLTGEADPRKVAAGLADDLWEDGVSIVDASGRNWGMETYTRMLVRTKSANAYNSGTLNKYAEEGVSRVRVFDGIADDEACAEANDQVWDVKYAMEHPIEHPNCRRAFAAVAGAGPADEKEDAQRESKTLVGRVRKANGQLMKMADIADMVMDFYRTGEVNVSGMIAKYTTERVMDMTGLNIPLVEEWMTGAVQYSIKNIDTYVESYIDPVLFASGLISHVPTKAALMAAESPQVALRKVSTSVTRAAEEAFGSATRKEITAILDQVESYGREGVAEVRKFSAKVSEGLDTVEFFTDTIRYILNIGRPGAGASVYGNITAEVFRAVITGEFDKRKMSGVLQESNRRVRELKEVRALQLKVLDVNTDEALVLRQDIDNKIGMLVREMGAKKQKPYDMEALERLIDVEGLKGLDRDDRRIGVMIADLKASRDRLDEEFAELVGMRARNGGRTEVPVNDVVEGVLDRVVDEPSGGLADVISMKRFRQRHWKVNPAAARSRGVTQRSARTAGTAQTAEAFDWDVIDDFDDWADVYKGHNHDHTDVDGLLMAAAGDTKFVSQSDELWDQRALDGFADRIKGGLVDGTSTTFSTEEYKEFQRYFTYVDNLGPDSDAFADLAPYLKVPKSQKYTKDLGLTRKSDKWDVFQQFKRSMDSFDVADDGTILIDSKAARSGSDELKQVTEVRSWLDSKYFAESPSWQMVTADSSRPNLLADALAPEFTVDTFSRGVGVRKNWDRVASEMEVIRHTPERASYKNLKSSTRRVFGKSNVTTLGESGVNGDLLKVVDADGRAYIVKRIGSGHAGGSESVPYSLRLNDWLAGEIGDVESIPSRVVSINGNKNELVVISPYVDNTQTWYKAAGGRLKFNRIPDASRLDVGKIADGVGNEQLRKFAVFDALSMESDAHLGNMLVNNDTGLGTIIDREKSFMLYRKRGVEQGLDGIDTAANIQMQTRSFKAWSEGGDIVYNGNAPSVRLVKLSDAEKKTVGFRAGVGRKETIFNSGGVSFVRRGNELYIPTGRMGKVTDRIGGVEFPMMSQYLDDGELKTVDRLIHQKAAVRREISQEMRIAGENMNDVSRAKFAKNWKAGSFEEAADKAAEYVSTNMQHRAKSMVDGGAFNITGGTTRHITPDGLVVEIGEAVSMRNRRTGAISEGLVAGIFEDSTGKMKIHFIDGFGVNKSQSELLRVKPGLTIMDLDEFVPNVNTELLQAADVSSLKTGATEKGFVSRVRRWRQGQIRRFGGDWKQDMADLDRFDAEWYRAKALLDAGDIDEDEFGRMVERASEVILEGSTDELLQAVNGAERVPLGSAGDGFLKRIRKWPGDQASKFGDWRRAQGDAWRQDMDNLQKFDDEWDRLKGLLDAGEIDNSMFNERVEKAGTLIWGGSLEEDELLMASVKGKHAAWKDDLDLLRKIDDNWDELQRQFRLGEIGEDELFTLHRKYVLDNTDGVSGLLKEAEYSTEYVAGLDSDWRRLRDWPKKKVKKFRDEWAAGQKAHDDYMREIDQRWELLGVDAQDEIRRRLDAGEIEFFDVNNIIIEETETLWKGFQNVEDELLFAGPVQRARKFRDDYMTYQRAMAEYEDEMMQRLELLGPDGLARIRQRVDDGEIDMFNIDRVILDESEEAWQRLLGESDELLMSTDRFKKLRASGDEFRASMKEEKVRMDLLGPKRIDELNGMFDAGEINAEEWVTIMERETQDGWEAVLRDADDTVDGLLFEGPIQKMRNFKDEYMRYQDEMKRFEAELQQRLELIGPEGAAKISKMIEDGELDPFDVNSQIIELSEDLWKEASHEDELLFAGPIQRARKFRDDYMAYQHAMSEYQDEVAARWEMLGEEGQARILKMIEDGEEDVLNVNNVIIRESEDLWLESLQVDGELLFGTERFKKLRASGKKFWDELDEERARADMFGKEKMDALNARWENGEITLEEWNDIFLKETQAEWDMRSVEGSELLYAKVGDRTVAWKASMEQLDDLDMKWEVLRKQVDAGEIKHDDMLVMWDQIISDGIGSASTVQERDELLVRAMRQPPVGKRGWFARAKERKRIAVMREQLASTTMRENVDRLVPPDASTSERFSAEMRTRIEHGSVAPFDDTSIPSAPLVQLPVLDESGMVVGYSEKSIKSTVRGPSSRFRYQYTDPAGKKHVGWKHTDTLRDRAQEVVNEEIMKLPPEQRPIKVSHQMDPIVTRDGRTAFGVYDPDEKHLYLTWASAMKEDLVEVAPGVGAVDVRKVGKNLSTNDIVNDAFDWEAFRGVVQHELGHAQEIALEETVHNELVGKVWMDLLDSYPSVTTRKEFEAVAADLLGDAQLKRGESALDALIGARVQRMEDVQNTKLAEATQQLIDEAMGARASVEDLPEWLHYSHSALDNAKTVAHHEFFADMTKQINIRGGGQIGAERVARDLNVDVKFLDQFYNRRIDVPADWDTTSEAYARWVSGETGNIDGTIMRRRSRGDRDLLMEAYDQLGKERAAHITEIVETSRKPVGSREWAEELFDFRDAKSGLETELTDVTVSVVDGIEDVLAVDGVIYNEFGEQVGTFTRRYTKEAGAWIAYHSSLFLDPDAQGTGFGRRFSDFLEDHYIARGVSRIMLEAADVGRYYWPSRGYDMGGTPGDLAIKFVERFNAGATAIMAAGAKFDAHFDFGEQRAAAAQLLVILLEDDDPVMTVVQRLVQEGTIVPGGATWSQRPRWIVAPDFTPTLRSVSYDVRKVLNDSDIRKLLDEHPDADLSAMDDWLAMASAGAVESVAEENEKIFRMFDLIPRDMALGTGSITIDPRAIYEEVVRVRAVDVTIGVVDDLPDTASKILVGLLNHTGESITSPKILPKAVAKSIDTGDMLSTPDLEEVRLLSRYMLESMRKAIGDDDVFAKIVRDAMDDPFGQRVARETITSAPPGSVEELIDQAVAVHEATQYFIVHGAQNEVSALLRKVEVDAGGSLVGKFVANTGEMSAQQLSQIGRARSVDTVGDGLSKDRMWVGKASLMGGWGLVPYEKDLTRFAPAKVLDTFRVSGAVDEARWVDDEAFDVFRAGPGEVDLSLLDRDLADIPYEGALDMADLEMGGPIARRAMEVLDDPVEYARLEQVMVGDIPAVGDDQEIIRFIDALIATPTEDFVDGIAPDGALARSATDAMHHLRANTVVFASDMEGDDWLGLAGQEIVSSGFTPARVASEVRVDGSLVAVIWDPAIDDAIRFVPTPTGESIAVFPRGSRFEVAAVHAVTQQNGAERDMVTLRYLGPPVERPPSVPPAAKWRRVGRLDSQLEQTYDQLEDGVRYRFRYDDGTVAYEGVFHSDLQTERGKLVLTNLKADGKRVGKAADAHTLDGMMDLDGLVVEEAVKKGSAPIPVTSGRQMVGHVFPSERLRYNASIKLDMLAEEIRTGLAQATAANPFDVAAAVRRTLRRDKTLTKVLVELEHRGIDITTTNPAEIQELIHKIRVVTFGGTYYQSAGAVTDSSQAVLTARYFVRSVDAVELAPLTDELALASDKLASTARSIAREIVNEAENFIPRNRGEYLDFVDARIAARKSLSKKDRELLRRFFDSAEKDLDRFVNTAGTNQSGMNVGGGFPSMAQYLEPTVNELFASGVSRDARVSPPQFLRRTIAGGFVLVDDEGMRHFSGVSVSYGKHQRAIPLKDMSVQKYREYVDEVSGVLATNGNARVAGWTENGVFYLDVVEVMDDSVDHANNVIEAAAEAFRRGQVTIRDVRSGDTIRTGKAPSIAAYRADPSLETYKNIDEFIRGEFSDIYDGYADYVTKTKLINPMTSKNKTPFVSAIPIPEGKHPSVSMHVLPQEVREKIIEKFDGYMFSHTTNQPVDISLETVQGRVDKLASVISSHFYKLDDEKKALKRLKKLDKLDDEKWVDAVARHGVRFEVDADVEDYEAAWVMAHARAAVDKFLRSGMPLPKDGIVIRITGEDVVRAAHRASGLDDDKLVSDIFSGGRTGVRHGKARYTAREAARLSPADGADARRGLAERLTDPGLQGNHWKVSDGSGARDGLADGVAVEVIRRYDVTPDVARQMEMLGVDAPSMYELRPGSLKSALFFRDGTEQTFLGHAFGRSVTVSSLDEYMGMRLFITPDGKAGFGVTADGQLVSVFNNGTSVRNPLHSMIPLAIDQGAVRADAFDTVLPGFYAQYGFQPVSRVKFSWEYRPDGWSREAFRAFNDGMPDVVFLEFDPTRIGVPYNPHAGYYVDDYMQGLASTDVPHRIPANAASDGRTIVVNKVWRDSEIDSAASLEESIIREIWRQIDIESDGELGEKLYQKLHTTSKGNPSAYRGPTVISEASAAEFFVEAGVILMTDVMDEPLMAETLLILVADRLDHGRLWRDVGKFYVHWQRRIEDLSLEVGIAMERLMAGTAAMSPGLNADTNLKVAEYIARAVHRDEPLTAQQREVIRKYLFGDPDKPKKKVTYKTKKVKGVATQVEVVTYEDDVGKIAGYKKYADDAAKDYAKSKKKVDDLVEAGTSPNSKKMQDAIKAMESDRVVAERKIGIYEWMRDDVMDTMFHEGARLSEIPTDEMGDRALILWLGALSTYESGGRYTVGGRSNSGFIHAFKVFSGTETVMDVLTDTKIRSFGNNGLDPFDIMGNEDATIDFWMMQIALFIHQADGAGLESPGYAGLALGLRPIVADAIRTLRHGVNPATGNTWANDLDIQSVAEAQEVLWSMIRIMFAYEEDWHLLAMMNGGRPWEVAVKPLRAKKLGLPAGDAAITADHIRAAKAFNESLGSIYYFKRRDAYREWAEKNKEVVEWFKTQKGKKPKGEWPHR